jgi:hypothetical protein
VIHSFHCKMVTEAHIPKDIQAVDRTSWLSCFPAIMVNSFHFLCILTSHFFVCFIPSTNKKAHLHSSVNQPGADQMKIIVQENADLITSMPIF